MNLRQWHSPQPASAVRIQDSSDRRARRGSAVAGLALLLLGAVSFPASAQPKVVFYQCADGSADVSHVFVPHVEQADLAAGEYSGNDIFNFGAGWADFRFNTCDGQGRPATTGDGQKRAKGQPNMLRTSGPEATSCGGCHHGPRSGGSGDFVANTFNGAELLDPVTFSIAPEISNERGTTGMFGAGYVELLAREMTAELHAQRDALAAEGISGKLTLSTKGVNYDVEFVGGKVTKAWGIDTDLIVKPFGAGGTKVSLRQFSVDALNRHHGIQAEERYDLYTGDPDFDEDGISREMTIGDVTTLVLWQAMLDRPVREVTDDAELLAKQERGRETFAAIGCTSCHIAELVLDNRTFCEPNRYNPEGFFSDTSLSACEVLDFDENDQTKQDTTDRQAPAADTPLPLPLYGDLKRHHMCDDPALVADPIRTLCDEQHDEGRPAQDGYPGAEFFMTAELWGIGESLPYGHNGRFTMLSDVILAHAGEARATRDAYAALSDEERLAIHAWLKSLKILNQPLRLVDG